MADSLRVKGLWLALTGGVEPLAPSAVAYPIADPVDSQPAPLGCEDLLKAIARGLSVRIDYEGGSRGLAPRDITPKRFAHHGGASYLVAFCHIDAYEKSFRLDRVRRYEVMGLHVPKWPHPRLHALDNDLMRVAGLSQIFNHIINYNYTIT